MEKEEKKKVSEILSEKSHWIFIGVLPVRIRPLTLNQIFDMGQYACEIDIDGLEKDKKINVLSEMLARSGNAKMLQSIFIVCAFRSRLNRFILGWYIRHYLTVKKFKQLVDIIAQSLDANFFLTSIIFLGQTKPLTEKS